MKYSLVLVPIVAVFSSILTYVVFDAVTDRGTPLNAFNLTVTNPDVLERLKALEQRAAELERTGAEISVLRDGLRELRTQPAVGGSSEDDTALARATAPDSEGSDDASGSDDPELSGLFAVTGGEQPLREYMAAVIEEEHVARQQRQREANERRRQEWQKFREGPYGRYNFQVNSIAKKLELDDEQKDVFFELLTKYDGLRKELWTTYKECYPDLNTDEAREQRQVVQEQQKELDKELEAEFTTVLDQDQAAAYTELSPWERTGSGARQAYRLDAGGATAIQSSGTRLAPGKAISIGN